MPDNTTSSDINFKAGCSPVCDVVRKPKRRKRKSRPLHRWLGMLATLPLVWVLVTGFLLNHSEDFGFEESHVTHPWVLAAYGMTPKGEPEALQFEETSLVHWDGVNFLNGEAIDLNSRAIGVVSTNAQEIIATTESLAIYENGELLEMLDELSLPNLPLHSIGVNEEGVVLKNDQGWWKADENWIEFSQSEMATSLATASELIDASQREQLAAAWAGGGLPTARVILDLHAGHFLGNFAKYFYDLVILCTLWLIGTGLVLQYRSTRRSRTPRP
jgi:hypothetical protein